MDGYHEVCNTPYGMCIINRHDQYVSQNLRQYGSWCQHELELLRQLIPSSGVVVEAGANYGAHTLAFARYVGVGGKVFAFEPQRIVFQALCGSIALNSMGNVFAFNAAAGDSEGWIEVPDLNYSRKSNFGGVSLDHAPRAKLGGMSRVPIMRIDELSLDACSLIKADVEGMEAAVVQGALDVIGRFRPYLYLENHDDERREPLIGLCRRLGYVMYWHGTVNDPNMLCIPSERRLNVEGLQRVTDGDSSTR